MTEIFLYIVNMSITATILAVVVLLLRLLLKKAPKWISVLLWGLVALRLICPFAVESPFSLIPKTDWVEENPPYEPESFVPDVIDTDAIAELYPGIEISTPIMPSPEITVVKGISFTALLPYIWLIGIAVLLLHTLISTIRLRRSVGAAIRVKDNVWESSAVDSPFVLGIIRPKIYIPRGMTEEKLAYVIAHEQAHICRHDHWWKPFGFILLTIHWFNPVMWLAYILLCRDIEMACDERVVRDLGDTERAYYSEALLECSVKRSMISACPLAFGEVGVKERIKTVLNYKKPAFWIIAVSVIACIVAAVCFLTNPMSIRNPWVQEYVVGAEGILGQVDKEQYESVHEDFAIGADKYGRAVFKNPFKAFDTMKELYTDGLTLIAEEHELAPISKSNYNLYKKFGWQVTSGSKEAQEQARFITGFLDIYENSFDKEKPNTDLPDPTVEGKNDTETIIASNISEETLTYEILKHHQEEIWAYKTTAVNDTVDEVFRKWGERIAAAGVDEAQNCVVVYVYDFDEGDIGRFKKALGHLSYILVEKDSAIEMTPDELEAVKFVDFIDDPSGMDIFVDRSIEHQDFPGVSFHYTAQRIYTKTENGEDTILSEEKIWNCYFSDVTGDGKADLCTTVTKTKPFIARRVVVYDYAKNRKYEFSDRDVNHYVLSSENGHLIVNRYANADAYENEPSSKGSLTIINDNLALAVYGVNQSSDNKQLTLDDVIQLSQKGKALTWDDFYEFKFRETGSGLYIRLYEIDETFSVWIGGGSPVTTPMYIYLSANDLDTRIDIRDGGVEEFIGKHTVIEETDTTYSSSTSQKVIADLFAEIESSPAYSSNPKDYIDAHPDDYSKLIEYGNHTLVYIFNEFLAGGQTGLHGHILCSVMLDLLNENEIIKYDPTNGQDYFDQWLASARSVQKQHDPVWLEVKVPSIALVLNMTGDISSETYVDQPEVDPDPVDTAISRALNQHYRDDEPTGLLHGISYVLLANETVSGTPRFGQTNHIEKEIYYLLVMHQKYAMQNGEPTAIGGSYIPTVLTFTKEDNGEYILDEYWEPRDGAYYDDDIKAKFPAGIIDEVWNMDAYSEKLKKQCADDVFVYVDNHQNYTEPSDF